MTYDLGGVAVLTFTATDVTGTPANATSCTITITQPDGTIVGPTVLTGTAGVYTYYFATTQAGRHTYAFAATGTPGPGVGVGAYGDVFNVASTASQNVISLADAKDLLRITTTTWDADLRFFIASITRFVDKYVGAVAPRQITERHESGGRTMMLRHIPVFQPAGQPFPLVAITPVLTYGVPYPDLSLLTVDKATGEVRHTIGLPFYFGAYDLTYWTGRTVTSENIQLGTQIMLKHLWALERNNGRNTGFTPSAADDTTVLYGFAVPNRALEVLEPDRVVAGIA